MPSEPVSEGSTRPTGRGGLQVPAEPLNSLKYKQPLCLAASCRGRAEILPLSPSLGTRPGSRESRGPRRAAGRGSCVAGGVGQARGTLPAAAPRTGEPGGKPGPRDSNRGPSPWGGGAASARGCCSGAGDGPVLSYFLPQIPGPSSFHAERGPRGPGGEGDVGHRASLYDFIIISK